MIKVTIDTHILIGGFESSKQGKAIFNKLLKLHWNRNIDVALSNRFVQDKANDLFLERRLHHLAAAKLFTEISSPFRMTLTQAHGFLVIKGTAQCLAHIFNINTNSERKNTTWDIDHLYGHLASKRDYFLTTENRILKKRPFLNRIRINVVHPENFLQAFDEVSKLDINNEVELKDRLSTLIDASQPDTTDVNFRKRLNEAIDRFLALEATELEQMQFKKQARDPSTDIGQVIATIAKWIAQDSFAGEAAVLVAIKEYPQLKQDYESKGAVYGNNYLGLIRWIDEQYTEGIF